MTFLIILIFLAVILALQILNYIFKQTLGELGDLAHAQLGKNHAGLYQVNGYQPVTNLLTNLISNIE